MVRQGGRIRLILMWEKSAMSVCRTWQAIYRVENKVRSLLSAFTWFCCLDLSLWTCLWNRGSFASVMVSFSCLVRAIRRSCYKLTHLCCPIVSIVWMDSTRVQSATTIVSRTSRSQVRSMNGLPISDILLTRDSTCQRNVACAAGLFSWWRVSETRPGLSIPSRNTDRGVKADSDFLHRSTPSNWLRSARTAGV